MSTTTTMVIRAPMRSATMKVMEVTMTTVEQTKTTTITMSMVTTPTPMAVMMLPTPTAIKMVGEEEQEEGSETFVRLSTHKS